MHNPHLQMREEIARGDERRLKNQECHCLGPCFVKWGRERATWVELRNKPTKNKGEKGKIGRQVAEELWHQCILRTPMMLFRVEKVGEEKHGYRAYYRHQCQYLTTGRFAFTSLASSSSAHLLVHRPRGPLTPRPAVPFPLAP